ncbi:MAG: DedA family protein [Paucibacter sp.]|nr:DedA family protein [Roseateles sp.]
MEQQLQAWIEALLTLLALPKVGLAGVFLVSLIGATLLPLASEPALLLLVKSSPSLFWPAILVATLGNTLGGTITWWMGYGAERVFEVATHRTPTESRALAWVQRHGPPALLLSWLPVIGDPLCAVAGWLKLRFWPCVGFMAVGKFLRYALITAGVVWLWL